MQKENATALITNSIVTCEFAPGSQLQETMLADRFASSRTKVREALVDLAARNFVDLEHNKGAVVAALDVGTVYSVFELRIAVEKASAVLAATRIDAQGIELLEGFQEKLGKARSAGNEDAYFELDGKIHSTIAHLSLNPLIEDQVALLRLHTRRCWYFYRDRGLDEVADFEGMQMIVDAVCDQAPEKASKAMFDHLTLYHVAFGEMLSKQTRNLNHV